MLSFPSRQKKIQKKRPKENVLISLPLLPTNVLTLTARGPDTPKNGSGCRTLLS